MITTSRYASKQARDFAIKLAKEKNERYVARGKRTIESLAALARRQGDETIYVIEEEEDSHCQVVMIKIDEKGGWKWE